jgi:hypothetical protein
VLAADRGPAPVARLPRRVPLQHQFHLRDLRQRGS